MKLSIDDLKTDRQWRASTGLDRKRFTKLVGFIETAYTQLYEKSIQERQAECPSPCHLSSYEDLLLFTLFSLKSGLTYDLLGLVTGMDVATAKRHQEVGLTILEHSLDLMGYAPKRGFKSVDEFCDYFERHKVVIIDATEQRTVRPTEEAYQQQLYSGKKNPIR